MTSDVDAFLRALGQPPAGGETPRERANLLLSLLEDVEVRDATGTDGRTVRTAAMEALLALGYPYALEVPPEVLAQVRGEASARGSQEVPVAGLVLAGLAVGVQGLILWDEGVLLNTWAAVSTGAAVLPPLLAVLGGWRGLRWARRVGVALMGLMGLAYGLRFMGDFYRMAEGSLGRSLNLGPAIAGVLLLAGAWLLSQPWTKE